MQLEHSFTVPVGVDDAWRVLLDIEQVAPCMPGAALETVDGDEFTGSVKVKLGPISLTYKGKASFVEKDEGAHRASIDAQGKDSRGGGTAAAKVTAVLTADGDAATRVDVVTDLNITGKPAQFGRGVMVDVGNKLIGQFADCLAGKLAAGKGAPGSTDDGPDAGAVDTSPAAAGESGGESAGESGGDVGPDASAPPANATAADAPAADEAATDATAADAPATGAAEGATSRRVSTVRIAPDREVEPIDLMASAGPAVAKRLVPIAAAVLVVLLLLLGRRRRRSAS